MELFAKVVNGFRSLIIPEESSISDVWLSSERTSTHDREAFVTIFGLKKIKAKYF